MANEIKRNLGAIDFTSATLNANSNLVYSPTRTISKSFLILPMPSIIDDSRHSIGNAGVTTGWKYNIDSNIYFGVTGLSVGSIFYNAIPEVINGATLDSIDLYYRINGGARTPTRLSMSIRRQDITGFSGAYLMANTQVTLYATTGYGAIVTTNFATTANQTIDTSLYTYMITVSEESGAGAVAGNNVYSFRCNYTVTNGNVK